MTDTAAQRLAEACASTLYERDTASRALGMQLLSVAPGKATLSMPVRADMLQGVGTCHGGYLFALADSAFAFACNTYDRITVAIGCSIDYVAPGHAGDLLTATAIEQSRSGRTGNYDVRIENQQGQLIALFHGKSYQVRGTLLDQETPNE
ncbi:hydroxyphenylacetyl-CoA thioesterase PaaI [Pseudomonas sp. LRF_L74]|uniref:hydroxyphenylacetyl-CoA thioesterase PaaI n=1 Tax=Pseudomonas sp. LRF_L74 TaxID=3369422 RepID=UPI003F5DB290